MLTDYLIVAGTADAVARGSREMESRTRLPIAVSAPGFALFRAPTTEVIPIGATGTSAMVGTIFAAGPPSGRVRAWSDHAAAAVHASGLGVLTEAYWGSYVAVAQQDGGVRLLRSPSGTLPCYYVELDGLLVAASSARLLHQARAATGVISWASVARQIVWDQFQGAETCLQGISELPPGEYLDVGSKGCQRGVMWTPWLFAGRDALILDRSEAVQRLREVVLDCVAAWASVAGPALLRLSGGLDSSIVAAGLSRASAPFSCLTMVTDDAAGDERTFARLVASHLGVPLAERFEDMRAVHLDWSDARDFPRPIARAFSQSTHAQARLVASETGAAAHFDGGGGDAVFCYLQSAAPVADRWLMEGPGCGVWQTAADMGAIADTAILRILAKATARAWSDPAFRLTGDTRFVSAAAYASAKNPPSRAWLRAPAGALPGKAGHIAWLLAMQGHLDQPGLVGPHPVVSPLMAQPVLETCLRVPTWLWCDAGRNRAIARAAFADLLPDRIIRRSIKGTPDGFVAQLFDARRGQIHELLLNGNLASAGLLDREALANAIDCEGPVRGDDYTRIMRLVDIEAWTRHWHSA